MVRHQRLRAAQAGYATVTVALPLGDITSDQLRALADIARKYTRETHPNDGRAEHRPALGERSRPSRALYNELKHADLALPGAGTIVDVVSCPGTDTCKLGISSSRGLAAELRERLAAKMARAGRNHPRPAHQDQRLLQLLWPASHLRSRLLRHEP